MMRATLFFLLAAGAFCQQLEVIGRVPIGEFHEGKSVRAWLCPSGLVFVTERGGEVIVVDGEGRVSHRTLPELMGLYAATCDDQGRIYFSTHTPNEASVWTYSLDSQAGLRFERVFRTVGQLNRLLIVGDKLYAVGLARVGSNYVFLRRFQLPEGVFLDSPAINVPMRVGAEPINRFAVEGSVFWHPTLKQVVYVPANPLEFWRLDESGKVVAARRPATANFINAPGNVSGNRDFFGYDLVLQAAALPDGRLAVQVISGTGAGTRRSSLLILTSEFQAAGAAIPTRDLGNFLGAVRDGTLYFVSFPVGSSSEIIKARLLP